MQAQFEPYSGRSPGGKGTRCHGQQHRDGGVALLRCSLGPSPVQTELAIHNLQGFKLLFLFFAIIFKLFYKKQVITACYDLFQDRLSSAQRLAPFWGSRTRLIMIFWQKLC